MFALSYEDSWLPHRFSRRDRKEFWPKHPLRRTLAKWDTPILNGKSVERHKREALKLARADEKREGVVRVDSSILTLIVVWVVPLAVMVACDLPLDLFYGTLWFVSLMVYMAMLLDKIHSSGGRLTAHWEKLEVQEYERRYGKIPYEAGLIKRRVWSAHPGSEVLVEYLGKDPLLLVTLGSESYYVYAWQ